MKTCPYCMKEDLHDEAKKCPHCGAWVNYLRLFFRIGAIIGMSFLVIFILGLASCLMVG